jgi:hypothetical protein
VLQHCRQRSFPSATADLSLEQKRTERARCR